MPAITVTIKHLVDESMVRHRDFERIRNEFITYYKDSTRGEKEYYLWLNALHLNETLCYSQTHESFTWARDMIKQIKEDADAKYYKVLCAFPLTSMNGNVYRERDLIAAAMRIANPNAHPTMNHEDRYKLKGVSVVGAKYEEGAVEAVIRVPKTEFCPVCGYDMPLTQAIDTGKIVNVSLEGVNQNPDGGFTFREDVPFTLLTRDVLPGIPLARVFPIEAYLPFTNSQSSSHKRTIRIVGLEPKMTKEQQTVCPTGSHWDEAEGKCVPDTQEPQEAVDSTAGVAPPSNPIKATVNRTPTTALGGSFSMPNTEGSTTILGENLAELKVKALRAEQNLATERNRNLEAEKTFELHRAETALELTKALSKISTLEGIIATHENTITKLERQIESLNKEKVADAAEVKSLTRRLEDMTESRDTYKKDTEQLKTAKEDLETKYRQTLTNNLALEKKLTETNEEYLQQAKRAEQLEDKVKHVNRITKITAKI